MTIKNVSLSDMMPLLYKEVYRSIMKYQIEPYLKKWSYYEKLITAAENNQYNAESNLLLQEAANFMNVINLAKTVLSKDELTIIYEFYFEKRKIDNICIKNNLSKSHYYRIRKNALEKINSFFSLSNSGNILEQK